MSIRKSDCVIVCQIFFIADNNENIVTFNFKVGETWMILPDCLHKYNNACSNLAVQCLIHHVNQAWKDQYWCTWSSL